MSSRTWVLLACGLECNIAIIGWRHNSHHGKNGASRWVVSTYAKRHGIGVHRLGKGQIQPGVYLCAGRKAFSSFS